MILSFQVEMEDEVRNSCVEMCSVFHSQTTELAVECHGGSRSRGFCGIKLGRLSLRGRWTCNAALQKFNEII